MLGKTYKFWYLLVYLVYWIQYMGKHINEKKN